MLNDVTLQFTVMVSKNGEVIVDHTEADYDYWTEINDKLDNFCMHWYTHSMHCSINKQQVD